MKLAKAIAYSGKCSRRDAERLIAAGVVSVNGVVTENVATVVKDSDCIMLNGKELKRSVSPRLWLYNKPEGLVVTSCDELSRSTVFDSLPDMNCQDRIMSIGRLDKNSSGLLLLTNYSPIATYMERPCNNVLRQYVVVLQGDGDSEMLHKFVSGIEVCGVMYRAYSVKQIADVDNMRAYNICLTEGKKREIRIVATRCGFRVKRLVRVAYGDFMLPAIKPGECQEVCGSRLNLLLEQSASALSTTV